MGVPPPHARVWPLSGSPRLLCSRPTFTHRLTLFVFHRSRCDPALPVFELRSGESLCLDGLCHVISGILAGGIPGFRMVLCCFTHSLVWPGGLVVFGLFAVLPYQLR